MSKRKYRRNASTYNNSREAKIDKTKDQETLNKEKYQFPMREDRADGQGDLTSIVRLYSGSPHYLSDIGFVFLRSSSQYGAESPLWACKSSYMKNACRGRSR